MTQLSNYSPATTFGDLFTVETDYFTPGSVSGFTNVLKNVQDGFGTSSILQISQTQFNIERSGGEFLLDGVALTASAAALNAAGAGSCPPDATYILQTPNVLLASAQDLSSLATGILKSTTVTGVLSIAVAGTDYYSPGNPTTIIDTSGTDDNLFIGTNCGNFAVTGQSNTFYGISVGTTLGSGNGNSVFGFSAGEVVISAEDICLFGAFAGQAITTASNVCAFGHSAGGSITTASNICLFGDSCGGNVTTGNLALSAFGFESAENLTTAQDCSFFGFRAGSEVTIANNCSIFGSSAGRQITTGASNCLFGALSGNSLIDGASNSFYGTASGSLIVSSNNTCAFRGSSASAHVSYNSCVFLGYRSDATINGLINSVAIGANSTVSQSNSISLGSECNVGINNPYPLYPLDIVNIVAATLTEQCAIQMEDSVSIPDTPSAGFGVIYVRGGHLWYLNSAGTSTQIAP